MIMSNPICFPLETMGEDKFQSLRKKLIKMRKKFDTFGIVHELGKKNSTSAEDRMSSYKKCCKDFCNKEFKARTDSPYYSYLVKSAAFTGILIHDLLGVRQSKNLSEHQNVLAHVLAFSLEGSFIGEKKIFSYQIFFNKLLPRSAFAGTMNSPQKLSLYFKECFNSMTLRPPQKDQLSYYYQLHYFIDVRGKTTNKTEDGAIALVRTEGMNGVGDKARTLLDSHSLMATIDEGCSLDGVSSQGQGCVGVRVGGREPGR